MRWLHIVLWACGWLTLALVVNNLVQLHINDRPSGCPYCAFEQQHHLRAGHHKSYPAHSWYYSYAMTRHANFHFTDEYSLSHAEHSLLEAALVYLLAAIPFFRKRYKLSSMLKWGFVISLIVETTWEVVENMPMNLQYYDFKNMIYCGDAAGLLGNSNADIICMAFGYFVIVMAGWLIDLFIVQKLQGWKRRNSALMFRHPDHTILSRAKLLLARVPLCVYILLFALALCLCCEMYMFHSVKDSLLLSVVQWSWGIFGWPPAPGIKWIHEARSKLVVLPGPKCHRG